MEDIIEGDKMNGHEMTEIYRRDNLRRTWLMLQSMQNGCFYNRNAWKDKIRVLQLHEDDPMFPIHAGIVKKLS